MEEKRVLLAILGRGIQRTEPNGPWDLTENIEVCDEKFAHLPVRVPQNDDHPNSIVGGGWLNLLAGFELVRRLGPEIVVCAFGDRSNYLKSIGSPSESEVMSRMLDDKLAQLEDIWLPAVHVFNESEWNLGGKPSNTNQELHNIFTLAVRLGITNVAVVTVTVHYARSLLFAHEHLATVPAFKGIKLQFYASENVLIEADPEKYGELCRELTGSKSFQRNFRLEERGVNALLSGKYNSVQSVLTSKS